VRVVWRARWQRSVLTCALLPALALFASSARAQNVRLSMSASSNRVAIGEPFAIEIRVETRGDEIDDLELPDFGELEVLGRSTSRPFSFSFGFGSGGQRALVKSEIVHSFTLRAAAAGAYVIRPAVVRAGGRRIASQSLSILVVDPAHGGMPPPNAPGGTNDALAPPSGALDGAQFDQTMFVRTVVDKKRAYVGEQVTVTVYLYLRGQIGDSPSITREPTLEGFWSQDLLPMQRSLSATRQEVNGRVFNAYVLRRFAAFPLRPGKLEIGAPSVEVGAGGSIFDLLTGPSQPLRRNGVKVEVEALPLPAQPTAGAPTHTGTLTLQSALDASDVKVGDAVTLTVTATGRGNLRDLMLPTPTLEGLEALAPEIDDDVELGLDQLGGKRTFRWLLLPRKAGSYTVPGFVVDVFDAESGSYRTVRTNALTLAAKGAVAAEPSDTKADEPLGVRFGPARPESELRRRALPLHQRTLYWPSVLCAPLLLLALAVRQLVHKQRAKRRAESRETIALREVSQRVEQARDAASQGDAQGALRLLTSALKSTLEVRLGEPVGGLTLRALEAQLRERALDPKLVERAIAQLSALERARFDPAAQGALELSRAVDGVRALTGELARARIAARPSSRLRERELT
jgi:hypothetical protein